MKLALKRWQDVIRSKARGDSERDRFRDDPERDRFRDDPERDRIRNDSERDRIRGDSERNRARGDSGHDRAREVSEHDRAPRASKRDRAPGSYEHDRAPVASGHDRAYHPFYAMVRKEMSDHIRSWRTNILLLLVALTCIASIYAVLNGLSRNTELDESVKQFLFLKLFTATDGTIPPFITFVSFLGPLLGIGMGFDALQSERSRGTLSRTLAQPVPRDYILNAKFTAALAIIGTLFIAMGLIEMALGILMTGIPPTPEQFIRMMLFLLASVIYVAFWLNLSILFSVRMKSAATSALLGLGLWIFFVIFYPILVNVVIDALSPATDYQEASWTQWMLRLSPGSLFQEATSTLLVPEIRTISGFITIEQAYGAIPSPLPLGQSLLLVWPQLTALVAGTMICFGLSYISFMRQEIRAR